MLYHVIMKLTAIISNYQLFFFCQNVRDTLIYIFSMCIVCVVKFKNKIYDLLSFFFLVLVWTRAGLLKYTKQKKKKTLYHELELQFSCNTVINHKLKKKKLYASIFYTKKKRKQMMTDCLKPKLHFFFPYG